MPDDECQKMKMPVDIMPLKKKREIMKIILDYKNIYIPQNYDFEFFLYNSVLIIRGAVHDTLVMHILFNFI